MTNRNWLARCQKLDGNNYPTATPPTPRRTGPTPRRTGLAIFGGVASAIVICITIIAMCTAPPSGGQTMTYASREELRRVLQDQNASPAMRKAALEQLYARIKIDNELIIEAEREPGPLAPHATTFREHLLEQLQD